MKAAVVTKDHHVDVTDKTLRSLKHGEALLKMECLWCMSYRSSC
ncbi:alcohol dehydrogenase [Escherichia coli]|nr:alcohol dehydrogenase [Escherichia coli]